MKAVECICSAEEKIREAQSRNVDDEVDRLLDLAMRRLEDAKEKL